MKRLPLIAALALAACSEPRLGAGIVIGPGGVSVQPVLSGTIGGVGVSASTAIE